MAIRGLTGAGGGGYTLDYRKSQNIARCNRRYLRNQSLLGCNLRKKNGPPWGYKASGISQGVEY